jgi:pyruvate formate lyase activating enzyme
MSLEIKGFLLTSFIDWDGKIVSVVFLPNCNFHCPFCHNAGLISHPQNYETIPEERVLRYLAEHRDFLDGICVTGGEPSLHKDQGLFEFMRKVKQAGFAIKFDTNGSDPDCLRSLIEQKLIDYIAMDIKGPLDERYDKLAGVKVSLPKIKASIKLIRESGLPYELRTTVVPTLLDEQDIVDLARQLTGESSWVLQQFIAQNASDESLRGLPSYTPEKLKIMLAKVRELVPQARIRGI